MAGSGDTTHELRNITIGYRPNTACRNSKGTHNGSNHGKIRIMEQSGVESARYTRKQSVKSPLSEFARGSAILRKQYASSGKETLTVRP